MIQPTALPAAGPPLLALDAPAAAPGATGGEAALAAPFSGFLAEKLGYKPAGMGPDMPEPAPPANPVAALRAALGRALGAVSHPADGKHPGKPDGKGLPELPETGAKPLFAQSEDQARGYEAVALPAIGEIAPGTAAAAWDIPAAETPQAAPATVTPVGHAIAAMLTAAPQEQIAPGKNKAAVPTASAPAPNPARPAILPAASAALLRKAPLAAPQPAQTAPALPDPVTADRLTRPAIALQTLAKLAEALARAAPAAARPAALAPLRPLAGESVIMAASAAVQPEAALAGLPRGQQILAMPSFTGKQAEPIAPSRPGDAEPAEASATSREAAPKATGKSPVPEAVSLLPAPQPLAAWTTAEPQVSPTTAPAAAVAATQPAAQPRDFAGLIDRLVEAREAAQSTLAPQTVQTALAHADFGKVSLQFQHDASGMTVAMASSDPDFSRAVQAAAHSAQMSSDTGTPQRQDSQGQSSANASFAHSQGQAQSQQRGQSPARDSADPRPAANPSTNRRDGDEPSARGGIFA